MSKTTHFAVQEDATGTAASPTDIEILALTATTGGMPVLDQIIICGDPGAATKTLTATLFTGADGLMTKVSQVFDANTPDTLNLAFPTGLPCWSNAKTGVYQHYQNAPYGSPYFRIEWSAAPTSCVVTILYHYEAAAERVSLTTP